MHCIIIYFKMSGHEELPADIRKQLLELQSKLSGLKALMGSSKEQAIAKHQKHLKRIKRTMDTYQYSIESGAFQTGVASHKSQYKQFQQKISQLQKMLHASSNDIGTQNDLFKNRGKSAKAIDFNKREVVVQQGNRLQKQSEDALNRIIGNVGQMDEQADLIVTELDRQIKKLDEIYDELSDTQTTLKRAQKKLKYFAKQVYTDRLMICLIIVIAIAIIVIIALAIAGKTPKALNGTVKL